MNISSPGAVERDKRQGLVGLATRSGGARRRGRAHIAHGIPALKTRFHRGDWRADIEALETMGARERHAGPTGLTGDRNQGWRMSRDAYAQWSLEDPLQAAREL